MDLKALAELKVDDIVEKLDALTVEQLAELRAIEADDANRTTLIKRIDAKLAEAADALVAPPAQPEPVAPEPAYLADDYTGPLTSEQALARLAKAAAAKAAEGSAG